MNILSSTKIRVTNIFSSEDRALATLHGVISQYEFPSSFVVGMETREALEFIFRQCNHVDDTEWINPETCGFKARSLSCGDIVEIGAHYFLCEGTGWLELPPEVASWYLANVSPRDFMSYFKSSVQFWKDVPAFVSEFAAKI